MNKRIRITISIAGIIGLIIFLHYYTFPQEGLRPDVMGKIAAKPISEVSGMAKSASYENTYWVVNDNRNGTRLFAINREGKTIIPTFSRFSYYGEKEVEGKEQWPGFRVLYAENIDWESMTIDENYLYIADTGNNSNDRRDLGIFLISEIDPTASTQSAAIRFIPVHYPEQNEFPGLGERHYDSEALFLFEGNLYLITKHRDLSGALEPGANLYRLDSNDEEKSNALTFIENHPKMMAVTGAELSPDGSRLAVISSNDLWIFDRPEQGDHWLSSSHRRYSLDTLYVGRVETIIWDNDSTLIISNEQRMLYVVDLADLGEITP
jgi:hypothetical protein